MKNFTIAREGKIYLQLRVEAQNVLNIRGLGPINTSIGGPDFGLITNFGARPETDADLGQDLLLRSLRPMKGEAANAASPFSLTARPSRFSPPCAL